ncbi:MAG: DUF1161 domain-containing protein [Campylobacteraceae bacterium]|jgi:hypothetical protein|nr:DUF1161 domain-containing protein [Campylobacteraceae bacterium]
MKKVVFGLMFVGISALFATPCEEVINMIAEKIRANGVKEFTLEAVDKGSEIDGKIVGVCGEGTKDIVYKRGAAAPVVLDNTTSE